MVTVEGPENLPASGRYLLVGNHTTYLDSIILPGLLPHWGQFVGKPEMGRNVLLRRPLAQLGVHLVERFDAGQRVVDAARIGEGLGRGEHPLFFAEGTLQRMPGLLPFQMGAFMLACEQKTPVIPLAISQTRNTLRSGSWFPRRGLVRVSILAGQQLDGRGWPEAIVWRNRVRQAILDQLAEPDLAGEFTSLLQMEIDRSRDKSECTKMGDNDDPATTS
jgi:1-acyl-sn-glycerol-3-phosphate acyltransferase